MALDALLTDGSARLLSNSKVVTLDGKPAEIFAGETVPVVTSSLQSPGGAGGGVFQTVQIEKIDVGVKLDITPRIAGDGFITTPGGAGDLAHHRLRRAEQRPPRDLHPAGQDLVRVRDGQKIYLGGLLSDEKRRTVSRVPILGRIPLLGYLFRHYRDDDSSSTSSSRSPPGSWATKAPDLPAAPPAPRAQER